METNDLDKVLIDTSIWIAYFRGEDDVHDQVINLIDQNVVCISGITLAELLQGAKTDKEINTLSEFTEVFTLLPTTNEIWQEAGLLSYSIRRKGITIGLADCFLAVQAKHHRLAIFTRDKHFSAIAKHFTIKLYI